MSDFEKEDNDIHEIFYGEKKPMHPDTVHVTLNGNVKRTASRREDKIANVAKDTSKEEKPLDAEYEPVKPSPDFMYKLKQTAKDTCMYAVLSMILFWWQQTGILEETTAWYSLLVCVGMVFFSIGKNCSGGVK